MSLHLSTYNQGTYTLTVTKELKDEKSKQGTYTLTVTKELKDEKPKQINTNAEGAQ